MTAERDRAVSSASGALVTSRPLSRITTWSTVWATSASRWLDTTTVRPASAWLRRKVRSQCTPSGSRPLAGSSRTSTDGSPSRAAARPRRWRMPSENPPTRRWACSVMADLGQRLVDPLRRQPGGRGEDAEVVDGPAAGVEAGGFQHGTDLAGGLVEVDVAAPVERGASRRSGRRGRAACAAWWSCRRRWVRGSR